VPVVRWISLPLAEPLPNKNQNASRLFLAAQAFAQGRVDAGLPARPLALEIGHHIGVEPQADGLLWGLGQRPSDGRLTFLDQHIAVADFGAREKRIVEFRRIVWIGPFRFDRR